MNIMKVLRTCPLTAGMYAELKKAKDAYVRDKKMAWRKARYKFVDRSRGRKKMCILLAGYKPFLYSVTFERITRFLDDDIDFCVVTSGLYSAEIDKTCAENGWSYLYTKVNNVALVQNLAIWLHPKAEYIYKMDEDIFVTQGSFKTMFDTLELCEKDGKYFPLFVAPLLPINGYCHLRILEKLGMTESYSEKFEKPRYAAGVNRMIESNPDAAKFFWGFGGVLPYHILTA